MDNWTHTDTVQSAFVSTHWTQPPHHSTSKKVNLIKGRIQDFGLEGGGGVFFGGMFYKNFTKRIKNLFICIFASFFETNKNFRAVQTQHPLQDTALTLRDLFGFALAQRFSFVRNIQLKTKLTLFQLIWFYLRIKMNRFSTFWWKILGKKKIWAIGL